MIQAALHGLHLYSPQPAAMADFYAATYNMAVTQHDTDYHCSGPGRQLWFSQGPAHQLGHAVFQLETASSWDKLLTRLANTPRVTAHQLPGLSSDALVVTDPDGNHLAFIPPEPTPATPSSSNVPSAVLQHFALRTQNLPELVAFYRDTLGFIESDLVHTDDGELTAVFLRTNNLHHALALFRAPLCCFDHQSFETQDWDSLKTWADRTGKLRTPIVWGIGRHGPGNDVFFMVRDPDDNLAEISAEIEVCSADRPTGRWPHEEWTLNQWGKAILRS